MRKPLPSEPRSEQPFGSEMKISDEMRSDWGAFWSIVNEGALTFGGSIVSGIRSEKRNNAVGGHPQSRHLLGLAADITFLPTPDQGRDAHIRCEKCFKWFYTQGLHGYIRTSETGLHIQDRSAKAPTR